MKNFILLIGIIFVLTQCSSTNRLHDESLKSALVGQDEMTIFTMLGTPTKIEHTSDGGKILIYESFSKSKGMYLTPNKSSITYETRTDPAGNMQGWTYTSNVNKVTNDPQYTIYQEKVSALKVYIDKNGKCTRYEQNLPQEELDIYHERFKHFKSKN